MGVKDGGRESGRESVRIKERMESRESIKLIGPQTAFDIRVI